ncbi:MAG: sigma-70 family RNA polymerase sigma factor [Gemmatales bacterium]|nr:sigma-70 family RNA polymerase sigma factor [Gemmatales bacterium]MDW8387907.1 sigma-70 family RNA polymerase sigma factor [Gemmatales bacterium]
MAEKQLDTVLQHIRQAVGAPAVEDLPDHQLLQRFSAKQEESAFAALVRRHGPMVLGVCRRILRDAHQAEDAFQATFLVLARKAGSIRKQESVASWLHGVALRVAGKARTSAYRRSALERQVMAMRQPERELPREQTELEEVLDQELRRLPEKYRAPLVLCYLEGKTNEEAARELGWTQGMVRGRLFRGRDMLRNRLARRGLAAISAVSLTATLSESATASVPPALLEATVRAGVLFAKSHGAVAGVSASTAALAQHALRGLFWDQLKTPLIAAASTSLAGLAGLAVVLGLGTGKAVNTESQEAYASRSPDREAHASRLPYREADAARSSIESKRSEQLVEVDVLAQVAGPGGFVPGLAEALEKGLGGPIWIRATLTKADGQPAGHAVGLFRWQNGEETVRADADGVMQFPVRREMLDHLRLALSPQIQARFQIVGANGEAFRFMSPPPLAEGQPTSAVPMLSHQRGDLEVVHGSARFQAGQQALGDLEAMVRLARDFAGLELRRPCRLVLLETGQAAPMSSGGFQLMVSASSIESAREGTAGEPSETAQWLVLHRWALASLTPDALSSPSPVGLSVRSALAEILAHEFCREHYPRVAWQRLKRMQLDLASRAKGGPEVVDPQREPNAAGGAVAFLLVHRGLRNLEPSAIRSKYAQSLHDPESLAREYLVPTEVESLNEELERLVKALEKQESK